MLNDLFRAPTDPLVRVKTSELGQTRSPILTKVMCRVTFYVCSAGVDV